MQNDLAPVRRAAMLEQINPLPSPEDHPPRSDRNGKLRLRKRGPDVRRHVVRTFGAVNIAPSALGCDLFEKSFEIGSNIGVGVLLNQKGGGGVAAENRQNTGGDVLPAGPRRHLRRDLDETFAASWNVQVMERLTHRNERGLEGFGALYLQDLLTKKHNKAPEIPITDFPVDSLV
jgi:hypothetical protein